MAVELRHEGVAIEPRGASAVVRPVKSVSRRAKHGRVREPGHVGLAGGVHRDVVTMVVELPTEEGGVHPGAPIAVQLRYESVGGAAAEGRLERARSRREVCRVGIPCHVSVAGPVDGDASASVEVAAPKECGVNEAAAIAAKLCDESV